MPKTSSKFKIRNFLSSKLISLPAYFANATVSPFLTPSHSLPTATILPVEVKRGMDKFSAAVIEELKKSSKKVNGKKEIAQVATI